MPQPAAVLPHASPDYDRTLVLAIELSSKSWVLAAQVPGLAQVKAKRTIEPTKEALLGALASYRARAAAAGHQIERVVSIYEAGWSGFWLARWLSLVAATLIRELTVCRVIRGATARCFPRLIL